MIDEIKSMLDRILLVSCGDSLMSEDGLQVLSSSCEDSFVNEIGGLMTHGGVPVLIGLV